MNNIPGLEGIKTVDAFDSTHFAPGTLVIVTLNGPYKRQGGGRYPGFITSCCNDEIEVDICCLKALGTIGEAEEIEIEIGDYISGKVQIEIVRRVDR